MRKQTLSKLTLIILAGLSQPVLAEAPPTYTHANGTDHITTYSAATYGNAGTITFNDWGYKGPQVAGYAAAGWNDYSVPGAGAFNPNKIGQIQKVVTYGANPDGSNNLDWKTPDPAKTTLYEDGGAGPTNGNMDGTVNFYKWAYTTPANSTFNNMKIDTAGNYHIARDDMKFGYYDYYQYKDVTGANPDELIDTAINFQPYAVSDAKGWCGSVMSSNPKNLEIMAGQVTFDFAFDAYMVDQTPTAGQGGGTQIVPGFVMRSYGDYVVSMNTYNPNKSQAWNDTQAELQTYRGSAVINNTDPVTGLLNPAQKDQVSFLGGGVVPKGVWVTADSYNADGTRKLNADSTWRVTLAYDAAGSATCTAFNSVRSDGAKCWQNSFGGYGFLMRADGSRTLEFVRPTDESGVGHSNYVATDAAAYVPVPAAAWLLGSGLLGLVGVARRKQAVAV